MLKTIFCKPKQQIESQSYFGIKIFRNTKGYCLKLLLNRIKIPQNVWDEQNLKRYIINCPESGCVLWHLSSSLNVVAIRERCSQ